MRGAVAVTTTGRMSSLWGPCASDFSRQLLPVKMTSTNLSREQLWKAADRKARKQGLHATIYSSDGSQYKGDWQNDQKHGEHRLEQRFIAMSID
jgi:hypothetical protein